MIKFFNTLSGKVEPFQPLVPGKAGLYTCGPTVYDYAHIGNFRSYIFEDLLKRFLQHQGFSVHHVMNITDVDDKTIKGSQREKISLSDYTRKYIQAFFRDIDTLNISRADHFPRATGHIPEMVDIIKSLLEKGFAYQKDGSYYFNVSRFSRYGRLSKIDVDQLKSGERTESDEYAKENVHDFALWKAPKKGEPFWETDIGPGRPGWHIECSAMSSKFLGNTFDIHCGGVDNIFPHHENEIAQSEAASGQPFVRYWLHCHHLIVEGHKMSKSKGNFYTLNDLLEKDVDPMALRFLLLSTHYRKTLNFTFDALDQAQASVQRMKDFLYELNHRTFEGGINKNVTKSVENAKKKFDSAMANDLNISMALSAVFEFIKNSYRLMQSNQIREKNVRELRDAIDTWNEVLAVLPDRKEDQLEPRLMEKIQARNKARAEKKYAEADRLRDELLQEGIILEDTKEGVRWKRK
ncbi:MAG: cysteine--tRNA ligase [Candidatus Aminicenantes bacterium]